VDTLAHVIKFEDLRISGFEDLVKILKSAKTLNPPNPQILKSSNPEI
jgi:hypothetical protein